EGGPALTAALKRESLRRPAAIALAKIGPKGWPPLLDALRDSKNPISSVAQDALERHAPYCLPLVVPQLRADEYNLFFDLVRKRDAATRQRLLETVVPAAALPPLLRDLKAENWWIRKNAALSLAWMG